MVMARRVSSRKCGVYLNNDIEGRGEGKIPRVECNNILFS